MGDAASATTFSYISVLDNCPIVTAVLTFAIAQSIKVFTTWYASLIYFGSCSFWRPQYRQAADLKKPPASRKLSKQGMDLSGQGGDPDSAVLSGIHNDPIQPRTARSLPRPIPMPDLVGKSLAQYGAASSGDGDVADAGAGFIHVPGVTTKAYVSRQALLTEIASSLSLTVHASGVVNEPVSEIRGWIEIDVPPGSCQSVPACYRS